jgi:molybdopterin molybdotransferase
MISVEEARKLIIGACRHSLPVVEKEVVEAGGYVLAEDIKAAFDMPYRDQTSVDGYAVSAHAQDGHVIISGEIKAGDDPAGGLAEGTAMRVFTGAFVPDNTYCIIMQEHTFEKDGSVCFEKDRFVKGSHIRKAGSQIRCGETALHQGTYLTPAAMGMLHAMGYDRVKVFQKPKISIVITGNELIRAGEKTTPGSVYESSSAALGEAMKKENGEIVSIMFSEDDPISIERAISKALQNADMVLISGGISVGKYDYVKEALQQLEVSILFHRVAQKPGKPLLAGYKEKTMVFALPGNPASSLTCLYEYVVPCMRKMSGRKDLQLKTVYLRVQGDINKMPGLTWFMKGRLDAGGVAVAEGQESFIMRSYATSDCLICLPQDSTGLRSGDLAEVHLIP